MGGRAAKVELASLGLILLLFRRRPETPELLFAGACCSIRWFVPLVAPLYFALALVLRECPRRRKDFVLLSAAGLVLGVWMWRKGAWMLLDGEFGSRLVKLLGKWLGEEGAWMQHVEPCFWPLVAPVLGTWAILLAIDLVRWYRSRGLRIPEPA